MELTDKNYNDIVLNEERAIFIDFYSPMCGPCQDLKAFISNKLEKYANDNNVLILTCNVSKNPKINEKFKIQSVPFTIVVTKDKKFKDPEIGLREPEYYFKLIDKYSGKKKKGLLSNLFK